jgi:transcriptional regulator with XRE-family HTH domain
LSIIGNNLKALRLLKRISQRELAKRSEISNTYINQIEQGIHNNPSLDILRRLASALDCKVEDLEKSEQDTQDISDKRADFMLDINKFVSTDIQTTTFAGLLLEKLRREGLIDENFSMDDNFKELLEDAIKLDAKLNNNLKKKGSS